MFLFVDYFTCLLQNLEVTLSLKHNSFGTCYWSLQTKVVGKLYIFSCLEGVILLSLPTRHTSNVLPRWILPPHPTVKHRHSIGNIKKLARHTTHKMPLENMDVLQSHSDEVFSKRVQKTMSKRSQESMPKWCLNRICLKLSWAVLNWNSRNRLQQKLEDSSPSSPPGTQCQTYGIRKFNQVAGTQRGYTSNQEVGAWRCIEIRYLSIWQGWQLSIHPCPWRFEMLSKLSIQHGWFWVSDPVGTHKHMQFSHVQFLCMCQRLSWPRKKMEKRQTIQTKWPVDISETKLKRSQHYN